MRTLIYTLIILTGWNNGVTAQENRPAFISELTEIMNNMKNYTLEVGEAMPADKYAYQPMDSVMSFLEQLAHLDWILHFHTYFLLENHPLTADSYQEQLSRYSEKTAGLSKEALLKLTAKQFDTTIGAISRLTAQRLDEAYTFSFLPGAPTRSIRVICQTIRDHVTHHRAQMVVYLRLKGIKPPAYRLF